MQIVKANAHEMEVLLGIMCSTQLLCEALPMGLRTQKPFNFVSVNVMETAPPDSMFQLLKSAVLLSAVN